jgi:hypothetical protein
MLTSAGGVGKSFLALRACIEMAAGLPILGGIWGPAHEGGQPVVYVSLEDDLDDLSIRVYDICQELGIRNLGTLELLEKNLVICNGKDLAPHPMIPNGIMLPTGIDGKAVNPKLIVIDTLSRYLGADVDENSSTEMTAVFKGIESYLRRYNAACLILHHVSKADMGANQRDEEAVGNSRGSSVITFNSRAAWALGCPSKRVAELHGIPDTDRWQYAVLRQHKVNIGMPHSEQWFRKGLEGVPKPISEPTAPPKCQPRNPETFHSGNGARNFKGRQPA